MLNIRDLRIEPASLGNKMLLVKVVAQKLKAAVAAIDAGTYKAPCKMTVAQWLDIWLPSI